MTNGAVVHLRLGGQGCPVDAVLLVQTDVTDDELPLVGADPREASEDVLHERLEADLHANACAHSPRS